MDAETERLIERARQRRELLNQKMGKTPEAAPRKRRTPLTEDLTTVNVAPEPEEQSPDDSPKRQRMRENEQAIKPDTPAIPGIRSRLQDLVSQNAQWSQAGTADKESAPVPTPRKSLSSPPLERRGPVGQQENGRFGSPRKNRFAELARNIDNWEDDLSHPNIVKEPEKKPRWQPPKTSLASATKPISSPKKTRAPPPPTVSTSSPVRSSVKSTVTSTPSVSQNVVCNSPFRSSSRAAFNSTPKPFKPYSESSTRLTPVKSPASSKSNLGKAQNAEKEPDLSSVDNQRFTKGKETPKTAPKPRLVNWENRAPETTNSDICATPKSGVAVSSTVSSTAKQICTPARPPASPAKEDCEVQMRPKVRKSIDDEPTAHPVLARLSAWEQMSSAQVISDIKKVKPDGVTPSKTAGTATSLTKMSPMRASVRGTPGKSSSITPSKSFKDSIKERAAQVNPVTAAQAEESSSPDKGGSLSPKKASSAMRAVQQQLVQQTQSTSMAERLRQERMAELQSIQDRWKNGILKDTDEEPQQEPPRSEEVPKGDKRQNSRGKAREDFNKKLASVGLDISEEGKGSFSMERNQKVSEKTGSSSSSCPLKTPPAPPPLPSSSGSKVTGRPPRPNSLYSIVSQKKKEAAVKTSEPPPTRDASKTSRKVKFDDSFESDDSDASLPKKKAFQKVPETKPAVNTKDDFPESDTTEDSPTEATQDDSDFEVVLRRPRAKGNMQQWSKPSDDDDDLSLSAFVPASVRRQSILPSPQPQHWQEQISDSSSHSLERDQGVTAYRHVKTENHFGMGGKYTEADSSSSLSSQSSAENTSDLPEHQQRSGYCPEDTEESVDDRDAIGDLLEEAMDSDSSEPCTSSKPQTPVMRKRSSHRKATEDGSLPFSINEYRASRNMQTIQVKQTIVRNSQYTGKPVKEEDVKMPTHAPTPAPRQSLQERIRELQELVQQEQNVIMQASNALNQCCSSSSYFAGSAEQVECNRILLISCQKRQAYMMEIQRLRETKVLDPSGSGPKGSLTISDIRLPLKKEFVTRIGTSNDTVTCYFILLLRNGPQVISTQMLSTHDPMMRGSLDFPNLIKINGITGSFKLQLEIYSMSVTHEAAGKTKKKKTPKKGKSNMQTVPTLGGHTAVRTTSFSQVASIHLNMKSLDKHSFNLERLSHLSPLHGMIYMNLKCLMEANVEERGFLTMFEDVSGFGSWHRRWCALSGNKLQYWKYPDDETRKDPMGYIDLKRCVTEKVGLISRDVCARPHTFELATVRQPRKGEKDTLVSRTYNTMTTVRHMLSADTKEERIVWCNKINKALANIRTWHSDAMRPIPKGVST